MKLHPLDLPDTIRTQIDRELCDGESLRWWTRPDPKRSARRARSLVILAIPWIASSIAFFLFWEGAWHGYLFAAMSLLVGIAMFATPFWLMRRASRLMYMITNQRAIVFGASSVRSFRPHQLRDLRVKCYRGEGGSIEFVQSEFDNAQGDGVFTAVGFFGIDDGDTAKSLLDQIAGEPSPNSK
jgi:hypothetical protein